MAIKIGPDAGQWSSIDVLLIHPRYPMPFWRILPLGCMALAQYLDALGHRAVVWDCNHDPRATDDALRRLLETARVRFAGLSLLSSQLHEARRLAELCLGCEACREVCPLGLDIPRALVALRARTGGGDGSTGLVAGSVLARPWLTGLVLSAARGGPETRRGTPGHRESPMAKDSQGQEALVRSAAAHRRHMDRGPAKRGAGHLHAPAARQQRDGPSPRRAARPGLCRRRPIRTSHQSHHRATCFTKGYA